MKKTMMLLLITSLSLLILPAIGYANVNDDLLSASMEGNLADVKSALNKGGRIDSTGYGGKTPLILSLINSHPKVATYLLEQGVDVNIQDKNGKTALMCAAEMGAMLELEMSPEDAEQAVTQIIKRIIAQKAAIDLKGEDGRTALMYVVMSGNLEATKLLIQQNADVNVQDKDGNSVLVWALLAELYTEDVQKCVNILELLIEHGADVSLENKNGETVIQRTETPEIIEVLQNAAKK